MDQKLLDELSSLHEDGKYLKIVDKIKQMPEETWDYPLISHFGRALNNLEQYEEAIAYLKRIEEKGKEDPLWHYRMGYAYYYLDQTETAAQYFEQVLALDPEDEDAKMFLAWCREEAGEESSFQAAVYQQEEMDVVEAHIEKYFGAFSNVYHELLSPDIHVDIVIVEPTEEKNYYTLVTMGMGAHVMNVPEELKENQLARAELAIALPPDWKLGDNDEIWYWPLRWLKILARLPINYDTWLGWGHTVPSGDPVAENTKLSGFLLLSPCGMQEEAAAECRLPSGEIVNFYQMIPLYEEEMNFKVAHDTEALLDRFDDDMSYVINIQRKNYVKQ